MLIDIIKTHALAEAGAGNWSAVAALLNAQTVEVRNDKSWTMADLITYLGPESAAIVGGTIQAAGVANPIFAGAWLAINITGLQLHTDERQAMIQSLATEAGWPAELTSAALSAGLTYASLAGTVVTAEECETEWQQYLFIETAEVDETRHEILLSVNRGTDGKTQVMARVTPVEFSAGVEVRKLPVKVLANNAALIEALSPILEGLK